jgi:hypothetical protein
LPRNAETRPQPTAKTAALRPPAFLGRSASRLAFQTSLATLLAPNSDV